MRDDDERGYFDDIIRLAGIPQKSKTKRREPEEPEERGERQHKRMTMPRIADISSIRTEIGEIGEKLEEVKDVADDIEEISGGVAEAVGDLAEAMSEVLTRLNKLERNQSAAVSLLQQLFDLITGSAPRRRPQVDHSLKRVAGRERSVTESINDKAKGLLARRRAVPELPRRSPPPQQRSVEEEIAPPRRESQRREPPAKVRRGGPDIPELGSVLDSIRKVRENAPLPSTSPELPLIRESEDQEVAAAKPVRRGEDAIEAAYKAREEEAARRHSQQEEAEEEDDAGWEGEDEGDFEDGDEPYEDDEDSSEEEGADEPQE